MINYTLADYILSLCARPDEKGKIGTLKVYTDATKKKGRGLNSIYLDRLIEHVGKTRAEVCAAIGSLMPEMGSGSNLHVVIRTDERTAQDKRDSRLKRLAERDAQVSNRMSYFLAAGKMEVGDSLPEFIEETVQ